MAMAGVQEKSQSAARSTDPIIDAQQVVTAREIETAVQSVRGTRSAFAERAESGYYLDIDIDRAAAARHGLNIQDVQAVIATAIGGMTITQTVEGRERYGVRVRYPQELRDTPEKLAAVLVPIAHDAGANAGSSGVAAPMSAAMAGESPAAGGAAQVPLGQIATIRREAGPMVVRTEGAVPTAWVYVDVAGRDIGGYVRDAQRMVNQMVTLPDGYSIVWSGQYEYMERANQRLAVVIPVTLGIIFVLLYLHFQRIAQTLMVMVATLVFAPIGGIWFLWAADYNVSVAVVVGFIALLGVVVFVGGSDDGKASVVVAVTDDLTQRFSAVDLVRVASAALGGQGGGGRPDMAQAGGPDASRAGDAIAAVKAALEAA